MSYVRGDQLTPRLQAEVLAKYVYRWTSGNSQRGAAYGTCPVCGVRGGDPDGPVGCRQHHPTISLVTDEQWLAEHAFQVTRKGELSVKQTHAEPAYMAAGSLDSFSRELGAFFQV